MDSLSRLAAPSRRWPGSAADRWARSQPRAAEADPHHELPEAEAAETPRPASTRPSARRREHVSAAPGRSRATPSGMCPRWPELANNVSARRSGPRKTSRHSPTRSSRRSRRSARSRRDVDEQLAARPKTSLAPIQRSPAVRRWGRSASSSSPRTSRSRARSSTSSAARSSRVSVAASTRSRTTRRRSPRSARSPTK
jgi:hypothetical protein